MLDLPKTLISRHLYAPAITAIAAVLAACTMTPEPASETRLASAPLPLVETTPVPDTCLHPGSIQDLAGTYKSNGFLPVGSQTYAEMAETLTSCLGAPSPEIRDTIGYEGLTRLLRDQALSTSEMRALKQQLIAAMRADDPDGVLRPFSALVLSEVVRADRVRAFMSEEERQDVLNAGINYLVSITDYRGFDPVEGWRHGIAHGADLLMQITLNPAYDRTDHLRVLEAIAAKITIADHAYVYNEGERLMRPIAFIWQAKTLNDDDWTIWFEQLVTPAPMSGWREAFSSQAGLTRLHNIKAALYPLFIQTSGGEPIPGLTAAISALP